MFKWIKSVLWSLLPKYLQDGLNDIKRKKKDKWEDERRSCECALGGPCIMGKHKKR